MKNCIKPSVILGLLLLVATGTFGQATTVMASARAVKIDGGFAKIHLRWLPIGDTLVANAAQPDYYLNAWSRYKKDGYIIKRRKLNANNTVNPLVEFTSPVLVPDSALFYQALSGSGLGAADAEAAGTIYGALYDEMETSPGQIDGKDIRLLPAAGGEEREQRYALTAVGAEISFKAAVLAKLAWVDTTSSIQVGASYEYEIMEAGAASSGQTGRSGKVVIKNLYVALGLPQTPKARFADREVRLSWRWFLPGIKPTSPTFQNVYSNYYVEVSTTSSTTGFTRINPRPIMSLNETSDSLFYEVPLAANGVLTYIRNVGVTAYGEEVNSLVTSGRGVDPQAVWLPRIDSTLSMSNGTSLLHWVFPSDTILSQANSLLNGFEIQRSVNMDVYQKVTIGSTSLFSPTIRQVILPAALAQGYYVVNARYKTGQTVSSAPVFIQRVDSLPPAVPAGLQASWETQSGKVRLNWTNNIESDLQGYKVFRSNLAGEELALLADVRGATTYLDTVMRIDNPTARYRILAYDKRFNQSSLSPVVVVVKPDLIAPAAPHIRAWNSSQEGVYLSWGNSSSPDVARHVLTRKPTGAQQAGTVLLTSGAYQKDSVFADRTLTAKGSYYYIIEAVDSTGNFSKDSVLIDVTVLGTIRPQIANFNAAQTDTDRVIRLSWACQGKDVVEFEIKRINPYVEPESATPSAAPVVLAIPVWRTVDGLKCETRDLEDFAWEVDYWTYEIVAVYSDGTKSPAASATFYRDRSRPSK